MWGTPGVAFWEVQSGCEGDEEVGSPSSAGESHSCPTLMLVSGRPTAENLPSETSLTL